MAMTGSDANHGIAGINVTPLIDVLLVLLIIFMVIVPVTSYGLDSSIPQPPKHGQSPPESAVVVQVLPGRDGQLTYLLNQMPLASSEVVGKLAGIFAGREQKVMFVKADPSIEYARVAEVIDMGHQASADTIGLITPGSDSGR